MLEKIKKIATTAKNLLGESLTIPVSEDKINRLLPQAIKNNKEIKECHITIFDDFFTVDAQIEKLITQDVHGKFRIAKIEQNENEQNENEQNIHIELVEGKKLKYSLIFMKVFEFFSFMPIENVFGTGITIETEGVVSAASGTEFIVHLKKVLISVKEKKIHPFEYIVIDNIVTKTGKFELDLKIDQAQLSNAVATLSGKGQHTKSNHKKNKTHA